jgi:putative ABC transport system permease protein
VGEKEGGTMKSAMQKDFRREIGHTKSRFFSIMILVALSVAFLSGLKATAPDMKKTGDNYLDSLHLADIQVLSTLGLTEDDIDALRAQDGIENAEGEYVIDAFADSGSAEAVVKVLSLSDQGINDVLLREGRMPARADECVVEENMLELLDISIGDTITLEPDSKLDDALAGEEYTVVGTIRSPVYIAVERGTSTIGSGTVKAYLYLPREAFTLDYYTAAYARVSGAAEMTAFYDEYDDYIDSVIDALEPFGDERAALRHDSLVAEATEKLDDAQRELDDAKAEADEELGKAERELSDARKKLDDGWRDYRDGQQELKDSRAELDEAYQSLRDGEQEYADGLAQYEASLRELEDRKTAAGAGMAAVTDPAALAAMQEQLEQAQQQLDEAKAQLDAARAELDTGWQEYDDGEAQYASGAQRLADAYRDLQQGEKDYRDGLSDYEDGKAEADEKIADAQAKITDARREVADIESCEWYLFSRSYNPGYTGFGQDADRMANLASVFPIIFFLVAALVCLTTMTRMVEEQRVQIGSLKAMGYSGLAISRKYLFYGLLPSLTGGVFGLVIGYILFPKMIFTAYQIMYQMPDIELHAYAGISLFSLLAAVACTTVATLWACLATLRETPASLMRPRTPKAGKRVFLEYIRPLWRKMSFTHKVTARNLFRYQKRFWMTVIGIGGCTALIIAGFGLRSSLLFTMSRQYDELFHYSGQVTLSDNVLDDERRAVEDFLAGDERIVNYVPCAASSATVTTSGYSTTAYIEVMEADEIGKVVDLFDYKSGDPITMGDEGVYIDQKLSELLDVSLGDTFFLDGDERGDVTVAGIYEHYTGHFVYMTPGYYESALGADGEPNAYLLNFTSDDTDTCNAIFEKLLSLSGVATTSRMRDTQDTYMHSMERVDFVVVIIILAAAALAMVVLFNLSNINITERQRELATIKLLGFYDGEVSAYVYRENIVLTVFGILMGCFMGHWLHIYLVRSTEIDLMMFGRQTEWTAYVYAAILTMLFSVAVNILAHFRMKKIDMVESLKSAE